MKVLVLVTFLFVSSAAFAEEFDKAKFQKACAAMLTGDGPCAKVEAANGKRKACVKEKVDSAPKECQDYLKSVN